MTGLYGRTVLVTGGAGFVGSHLVDALAEDNNVRILDDLSTGRRGQVPSGVRFREADILDTAALDAAMDGVDVVFHLAAAVSVAESIAMPDRYHAVNATGTLAVLEAARRQDARVVVASSAAVYGAPETVPVTEAEPTTPSSPYGVSKLAADHYARVYADTYGLETVTLRYFNIYGPRQRAGADGGVVATFADRARHGKPLVIEGDGEQTRDFVHVSDVVQANLLAATTDATGRAYNIGTGETTTVGELAALISDYADRRVEITYTDPRPGDIRHSSADISLARDVLGYEPTVALDEGLAALFGATAMEQ
ncbi:NAD-dependent epimerase/dehydratase family protein [Halorarius litoreus]|uniref:NAD-dependent epimerase/dehydratase family protein n=1 Tax=Halorarius litoreus TaxID=2962676 RepID=UPI0020CEF99A|nr:NAD-dependent epimerase/dehydratase family protein [Halorarius litoreus]